jgi:4-aminobutyrate aminotransferase-like enzyme
MIERGVVAGTSSDPQVLRLLPPLTIGEKEVAEFLKVLKEVLTNV